jgi:hypothetical protein
MQASHREKVWWWTRVVLVSCCVVCVGAAFASWAGDANLPPDFSGSLVKQVEGRRHQAHVFAKGDRLRLEYKYALKTDRGYAAIEIIRLDKLETWYVLAQRKELLVTPLDPKDVLPIRPTLPGEKQRVLVGAARAGGREAQLYDVQTDYHGRAERFFEWVDVETGVVLKLVSQDRDWSIEYERFRLSPQPESYFDEPPGYIKHMSPVGPRVKG